MSAAPAKTTLAKYAAGRPGAPINVGGLPLYAKAEAGEAGGPITFVISTDVVDRAGDTLAVDGWEFDEYLKNPVFLWMHDPYTPPIGKALRVYVEDDKLKSRVAFASAVNPFAKMIEDLYRGEFLRAVSVGFVSDDNKPNDEGGLDFQKQSLREHSGVTIPCNPDALVEAKSSGIDTEPLREWAHHAMERLNGSGVWVPKAEAETLIKALGGIKTFSIPTPSASTENDMAEAQTQTVKLVIEVDATKAESVIADLTKKAKNLGALLKSEAADAANDDMASHVKAFGKMIDQHAKAIGAQEEHVKAMGGYCADLEKHIKALKDAADGDGDDKSATVGDTKSAAHKLSASQMKRVKAIAKAASEMQAAHHDSQGAADGEPDGDEGEDKPDDADKAATEAKQKALEAELAALLKEQKEIKMRLTGKVS